MYQRYVKVEHTPSGMTAMSDADVSNIKNKRTCMSVLRGKLWHLERGADTQTPTEAQRAIAARLLASQQ